MVINRRTIENEGSDFYPTPYWATHALMENEKFEGEIWEPACGDGAMSEVIKEYYGKYVYSFDLHNRGYEDQADTRDFLAVRGLTTHNIITNPPYNIADEFLAKALATAEKKVAFLVRLAYLEGQKRYESVYSRRPPNRVWVFSERITFYKKGATVKGSGTTAYGWFIWDNKNPATTTELKWLPPGYKDKYKNWKSVIDIT